MTTTFQHDRKAGFVHRSVADHVSLNAISHAAIPVLRKKEGDLQMKAAAQPKSNDEAPSFQRKVIQAKKTAPFNLERKLPPKFLINYSEYKGLNEEGYKDFIYRKLKASYDKNLDNGTRYWDKLESAIAKFKAKDNTEFLQEQAAKHADYDARFEKNYGSTTRNHWWYTENVDIGSSGLEKEGGDVKPDKDVPYTNSVSFEDNSISANHNYAERDEARKQDTENKGKEGYKDRGLPNSEILWQQYKLAAKNQFWFFKDSRAKELMKGLSAIKRRQVQNPSTMMTILFALPDGVENLETAHNWQAGTEEFTALLGTPNCSGAAFLLSDHVDDLDGKSITDIDLLGGDDVNLDIKIG